MKPNLHLHPLPFRRRPILMCAALFCLPFFPAADAGTLSDVRSVRITNTRADWFYLEEIRILNMDGVDVASVDFGSVAETSEPTAFGAIVEGAIDDVFGDCCGTGFHSSSSGGGQSYVITFPSAQTITGAVTLWNRQDGCCSERLDGMEWEYFDGPGATGALVAAQTVNDLALDSLGQISTPDGASFELAGPDADTDGDGLIDRWEMANGLDHEDPTGDNGAAGDPDTDGSTNEEERDRGTDPQNPDSDGDGLIDSVETGTGVWAGEDDRGTDPLNADSDGDSLGDGEESGSGVFGGPDDPGTDPNLADSDGDGFRDEREIFLGSDPTDGESTPPLTAAISGVRSVRITNTQPDWFYLEELELRSTSDEDVASLDFGTTATASEPTPFGGTVEGAIDDVFGNCCASGFHSSTSDGEQFLTITFPSPQDLAGDIRVWNRQDGCCPTRLDSMLFEFFDGEDGAGNLLASQQVDGLASAQTEAINGPLGATEPLVTTVPLGPVAVTRIAVDAADQMLLLRWRSNPGEFFEIDRSPDLTPDSWETITGRIPAATAPADETEWTGPEDPSVRRTAFYQVRRAAAPPLLEEGFEGDAPGWTAGTGDDPFPNMAAVRWEIGVPGSGPGAAHGGERVYATGLDGDYDSLANLTLSTPAVDLAGKSRATLQFWYFLESSPREGLRLEFLDAEDPAEVLAQTDVLPQAAQWSLHAVDLRNVGEGNADLLGRRVVILFRFLSDEIDDDNGAGFYLDDVLVE